MLEPGTTDRTPAQVRPAETPGLAGLLTLAVGVVVVAALFLAREVLIPITLAMLLSFVLAPLVNLLRRIHLGRVISVLVAVVIALGLILALGGLIGMQIADLASEAPRYQQTIEHKLEAVRGLTLGRVSAALQALNDKLAQGGNGQPAAQPGAAPGPGGQSRPPVPGGDRSGAAPSGTTAAPHPDPGPKPLAVEVRQPAPSPIDLLERVITPILGPLATTGIVFIVAIFVLLQREDLRDRLIRLFGSRDLHRTTVAMNDAARRLSRYFLLQLLINVSFGVIIGVGLFVIGVPSPVLWGVLGTLLRFVPYVGAPLSALLPLLLGAAVSPGWSMVIATAALYLGVEVTMGQVVEPMVYGRSTGLSPFSVVVAATFWTWLWGPIGLILSTPLTLCLVVLGRHVERLEFLDVLLGDRPALTPVESFYQRILAGDPDEAEDQAEVLLKDRSLSSYYDEIALRGLQLAASDAQRGALTAQQVERVKGSIISVIEALGDHDDIDPNAEDLPEEAVLPTRAEQDTPKFPPPPGVGPGELAPGWQGETPVLCVAGRGPLDEAAATMLAQLLGKHGIGARMVTHEAVSRTGVALLDITGVAMVCISYLELAGSATHLRYLLRRLRLRLPGAPMLVGFWPSEDELLQDERARAAVGADYYTCTLRDAVEACVDASHALKAADLKPAVQAA